MLFLQYLQEIKYRILFVSISFISLFISCYYFSTEILIIFTSPLKNVVSSTDGISFIFTKMSDAFATNIQIAFLLSFVFVLPIIFINFLCYIIPGLYVYEKTHILRLFFISFCCFIYINILNYYFLIPVIWDFFLKFQILGSSNLIEIKFEGRINEYVTLICYFLAFFNVLFQFPILTYVLVKFSIVNLNVLKSLRKIIYFGFLILAAVLTPPDILSQVLIFIPIFIIYEVSLFSLYIIESYNKNIKCHN
jgi:sec-independent protein translocase protein TatC